MFPRRLLLVAALALATLASAGCPTKYLPNTKTPDNADTRAIFDVLMTYRTAMENRDVEGIKALVSRRYFENGGTTDRHDDDYGYDKLVNVVLPKLRENTKAVQYRVLPSRIEVDGDRAWASYEYFYIFKYVEGGQEGFDQKNDYNRLDFAREQGKWKIISGL